MRVTMQRVRGAMQAQDIFLTGVAQKPTFFEPTDMQVVRILSA